MATADAVATAGGGYLYSSRRRVDLTLLHHPDDGESHTIISRKVVMNVFAKRSAVRDSRWSTPTVIWWMHEKAPARRPLPYLRGPHNQALCLAGPLAERGYETIALPG